MRCGPHPEGVQTLEIAGVIQRAAHWVILVAVGRAGKETRRKSGASGLREAGAPGREGGAAD